MESIINRTGETVATRVVARFREQLDGELLTPGDREYDAARQIWNAMIDRRPALIARCTRREDVQYSVAFATEHDLLLSIRGGGHNIAGLALCDGGLTIDLSQMKAVDVDGARKTVRAQAESPGESSIRTRRRTVSPRPVTPCRLPESRG
jgi:hypothetical protein